MCKSSYTWIMSAYSADKAINYWNRLVQCSSELSIPVFFTLPYGFNFSQFTSDLEYLWKWTHLGKNTSMHAHMHRVHTHTHSDLDKKTLNQLVTIYKQANNNYVHVMFFIVLDHTNHKSHIKKKIKTWGENQAWSMCIMHDAQSLQKNRNHK